MLFEDREDSCFLEPPFDKVWDVEFVKSDLVDSKLELSLFVLEVAMSFFLEEALFFLVEAALFFLLDTISSLLLESVLSFLLEAVVSRFGGSSIGFSTFFFPFFFLDGGTGTLATTLASQSF